MNLRMAIFALVTAVIVMVLGLFAAERFTPTRLPAGPEVAVVDSEVDIESVVESVQRIKKEIAGLRGQVEKRSLADLDRLERRIDALTERLNQMQLGANIQHRDTSVAQDTMESEPDHNSDSTERSVARLAGQELHESQAEQLHNLRASVTNDTYDAPQSSALLTLFANQFGTDDVQNTLIVQDARCAGRNCLVDIIIPAGQDPEDTQYMVTDKIPAEYGGYSTFLQEQVDGTHTLTIYLQASQ